MTATAVVAGSTARVEDVAQAIERRGVTAMRVGRYDDLAAVGQALAAGSLDYFFQLPDDVISPSTTRTSALAALFGRGLIHRFDEVEVLAPKMARHGAVVLVTGEIVEELSSPEYPHAPTCVLEMLAQAVETDLAPAAVRATVVSHRQSADQIAAIALAHRPMRATSMAGYAAVAPEMSYDDWRLACLSGTGPEA